MSELNKGVSQPNKSSGISNQGGTTSFGKNQGRPSRKSKMKYYGWVGSQDQKPVPAAYKIKVVSTASNVAVIGIMQEKTTFRATSEWGTFIPIGGMQGLTNQLSQLFGGRTLMTKFMSRRIWKGTSPITIALDFNFQSVNNTLTNVVYPAQALLSMALPSVSNLKVFGQNLPLLKAPGPSPFHFKQEQEEVKGMGATARQFLPGLKGGDIITLSVGNHLFFPSVIVKEVTPTFDTRMDPDGWPISATVNVLFETYEIITKEDLENIFFSGGDVR